MLSESQQECYRSRGPLGVDWIRMSVNCKLRMKAECFLLLLNVVLVVKSAPAVCGNYMEEKER